MVNLNIFVFINNWWLGRPWRIFCLSDVGFSFLSWAQFMFGIMEKKVSDEMSLNNSQWYDILQFRPALPRASDGELRGQHSVTFSRLWAEGSQSTSPCRELWASSQNLKLVKSLSDSRTRVPSQPPGHQWRAVPLLSHSQRYSSPGLP